MLSVEQRGMIQASANTMSRKGLPEHADAIQQAVFDLDEALVKIAELEAREARESEAREAAYVLLSDAAFSELGDALVKVAKGRHALTQSANVDNGGTIIQSAGTVEAGAWMVGRMG